MNSAPAGTIPRDTVSNFPPHEISQLTFGKLY